MKNIEIPACQNCESRMDSIFSRLDQEELEDISRHKGCNFFRKGQEVFFEGNYPTSLYCIYRGKVKLAKIGDEGKLHIVRFAGKSDILGYRSLIGNEKYSATATALEDSVICSISKKALFTVLKSNPELGFDLMQIFSRDLKSAEDQLTNLMQKTVRERLCEALLMLRKTYGDKDKKDLGVLLKREELASLIGTATETVIRILADLKKEGIIGMDKRNIEVLNKSRLIREANIID